MAMTLEFPNPSRSYDESRRSIRFSGYDGAFEVLFSIDAEALPLQAGNPQSLDEDDFLLAFDRFRTSIQAVACEMYSRDRKDIYRLKATDFK
jgi:hypothetical protein